MAPGRDLRAELDSGEPFVLCQLLSEVKKHAVKGEWAKAAVRDDGRGLERGLPSLEVSKRVCQQFKRRGSADLAAALTAVTHGAVWTRTRLPRGGGGGGGGGGLGGPHALLHRFW